MSRSLAEHIICYVATLGSNLVCTLIYSHDLVWLLSYDSAVTVAAQTNSLLVSVELSIVGFSVLEIKIEKLRQKEAADDYHNYQYDG